MSFADDVCGVSIAGGASVLVQGRWSREGGGGRRVGVEQMEGKGMNEVKGFELNWLSVELVPNSAKQKKDPHMRWSGTSRGP